MASDEIEKLLKEIGAILATDTAYPLDGTFLYVEAASQMVDTSIYKDLGDHLLFRLPMTGLAEALIDLWDASEPGKHWEAMRYWIADGTFTASFTYPDEIDPNENSMDRRTRIVRERYGNKQVIYPSIR